MDGLANVTGAVGDIAIGGVSYTLSIPTAGDYGEMERHVIALRGNPLKELAGCLDDFPLASRQAVLRAACDSVASRPPRATAEEIEQFSGSPDGINYMFFIMVRRKHPEIDTTDKAGAILADIDAAGMTDITLALKALSTVETAVKNSRSTEQIQETTDPHESRGLGSIAT